MLTAKEAKERTIGPIREAIYQDALVRAENNIESAIDLGRTYAHVVLSEKHVAVKDKLADYLKSLGYTVEVNNFHEYITIKWD